MFLTVLDAAARLGVCRTSVYELIKSGQLQSYRFGKGRGAIRISEGDLTAYQESSRVPQNESAGASLPPAPVRLKHLMQ